MQGFDVFNLQINIVKIAHDFLQNFKHFKNIEHKNTQLKLNFKLFQREISLMIISMIQYKYQIIDILKEYIWLSSFFLFYSFRLDMSTEFVSTYRATLTITIHI